MIGSFGTLMATAVFSLGSFYITDVVGVPGGTASVSIVRTDESPIVGFQMDIMAGPGIHLESCSAPDTKKVFEADIKVNACDVDSWICRATRIFVLSLEDTVPFDPGIVADCTVSIDAQQPPGGYPVDCKNVLTVAPFDFGMAHPEPCTPGYIWINSGDCPTADQNGDGTISISEVMSVINAALDGCP